MEREYVIPLREKSRVVARYKKTPKAIKTIKEFLAKHMKVENRDLNKIKIDKDLNQFLWARGIRKHPHKIKVKAIKKGENIIVQLVDYPDNLKFKKLREEKARKAALENIESKKGMMQKMKESLQKPEEKDENKDGVDDKKEIAEKEKATVEANQKFQKEKAKQAKHQTEKPKKAVKPVRVALQK
ncbi:50S ribosomal protein L31e [Candidatus Pacearchaeota archaeon]|nr:50S ribosomal protein L31e [Candidatus Pacearchaeota archaeon]